MGILYAWVPTESGRPIFWWRGFIAFPGLHDILGRDTHGERTPRCSFDVRIRNPLAGSVCAVVNI